MRNYFLVVNIDTFFLSHRLPLALRMKEEGYSVYVLTRDSGSREKIESYGLNFIPVAFDRSGQNPFYEVKVMNRLIRLIRKYKPEIIHNVTIKPVLYVSFLKKVYGFRSRVINAVSGLGYNFIGDRNSRLQKALKSMMKFSFKSNVSFIFQNEDDKNIYQSMGLLKDNFTIIRGAGVDVKDYAFSAIDIHNEKIKVVLTARMLYDKGVIEFIEAAKLLRHKYEGRVLFQLAGGIDSKNPAGIPEKVLKAETIGGYIEWLGHTDRIKDLLIESRVVCLPSYREGVPKSLLEAMAIGRPIVTTDAPGCRECVVNGENGYLVPVRDVQSLAEKLDILISTPELCTQMGVVSREMAERDFSVDKVLESTLRFYNIL